MPADDVALALDALPVTGTENSISSLPAMSMTLYLKKAAPAGWMLLRPEPAEQGPERPVHDRLHLAQSDPVLYRDVELRLAFDDSRQSEHGSSFRDFFTGIGRADADQPDSGKQNRLTPSPVRAIPSPCAPTYRIAAAFR